MRTRAVRLYGKRDLRLEEFELPGIKDNEILARVISDSICMSTYKAAILGKEHKRVPDDVDLNPIIIGHEFSGVIIKAGEKWRKEYPEGSKFAIQPALNKTGTLEAPGYSFRYIGGDATYVIIPPVIIENGNLLLYEGESFFAASLSEPMSCIIGSFHSCYHVPPGTYAHRMDIRPGGNMAIVGGAGPMGLGAIDYAIHRDTRPRLLVVTDTDNNRLRRASMLFKKESEKTGMELHFLNTAESKNIVAEMLALSGGKGFDDVFVFTPVSEAVEQADAILGFDGCLVLFAGPSDPGFSAKLNMYRVHYSSTHIIGTTGGNTDDMSEALDLMASGRINPAVMITHVGGLDAAADATLKLPHIPGGKKLIYTNIAMPLISLDELSAISEENSLYKGLSEIVRKNDGIWSGEAEKFLLSHAVSIESAS
jgi:threonine dehydrogenase-like Zn-dependent dehydrogenase